VSDKQQRVKLEDKELMKKRGLTARTMPTRWR
jgi:hypothetical protein